MTELKSPPERQTPICAIGASAGGLAALRSFFSHVSDDLGLAYVVIVHLAPDHPSALCEILAQCTSMTVQQVKDAPELKPNCVYVIPPDRELVINGNDVTARPFSRPRGQRAAIDMFFKSIAEGRGDSVAIILSGSGSDGSLGAKSMKEAGGVILVQDPDEAEYDMMPKSAIATHAADMVGPVDFLAEQLAEIAGSKEAVRSIELDGSANELRRIVAFLRARTGHDFSHYKRATVMRRVTRRMQVTKHDNLAEYADFVRATPEEAEALFGDLLISVTAFFRDPSAFDALGEKAVGAIFDELEDKDEIRVWSVGCATGEEAYSIAILLMEEADRRKISAPLQIFASDLDESALALARAGRYPKSIEADVSEARLRRFFIDEGDHYRVSQELRDAVLFASHSVLKDPPFIRLDLVVCRNLLIYLERSLQKQLCTLFHYGLKPNRYLFLGSAETADLAASLFRPIDREARLYRSLDTESRIPPGLARLPVQPRLPEDHREGAQDPPRHGRSPHAEALENLAPPSVLVDEEQRIVNLSPTAGRYILHSGGPLSAELSAIVRPELRLDLKIALERALQQEKATLTAPAIVAFNGDRRRVAMSIAPRIDDGAPRALVSFLEGEEVVDQDSAADGPDKAARPGEERRLHEELKTAHERLTASRLEHDTTIQELLSANEELQSINEEYRSTSEELETSKEELQSMNEELQTVNAELKKKLESIASAHNDLKNLTMATEIGTLFLDSKLRIKMFTPPTADLFNIVEADIGRSITDFTHRLAHDGIEKDARAVLRDLSPIESEVKSSDGRWYMVRVRPYRTVEDRIEGVVVTLVEITQRRRAEMKLRESERHLSLMVGELNHRVKNTLAIVQAIARQTLDPVLPEAARLAFEGRLQSLAGAHSLLTRTNWKSAGLRDLVAKAFDCCGAVDERVQLEGPDVELSPSQAVPVAMALHELCTNAVKYGAFSNDHGCVAVTWRLEEGEDEGEARTLDLEWRETDGPAIEAPSSKGYGTLLVEEALAQSLQASVTMAYEPDGVRCLIRAPLGQGVEKAVDDEARQ